MPPASPTVPSVATPRAVTPKRGPACMDCEFFAVFPPQQKGAPVIQVCRRFPPQVTPMLIGPAQMGSIAGLAMDPRAQNIFGFQNTAQFPPVAADWWCGEFQGG